MDEREERLRRHQQTQAGKPIELQSPPNRDMVDDAIRAYDDLVAHRDAELSELCFATGNDTEVDIIADYGSRANCIKQIADAYRDEAKRADGLDSSREQDIKEAVRKERQRCYSEAIGRANMWSSNAKEQRGCKKKAMALGAEVAQTIAARIFDQQEEQGDD